MTLEYKYPAVEFLKPKARRRIPHFVWEYLDSGTGAEVTHKRNRTIFEDIKMMPSILHGPIEPDTRKTLLGKTYDLPFGVAPVGMSGLVWPDAESLLAKNAGDANIPYCLSTVACQTPEQVGPHTKGNGWFQLYPPRDPDIRRDMLRRVKEASFETLVLTVDLPEASRRERQARGGITHPPVLTARLLAQIARRPAWAMATALHGRPEMPFVSQYGDSSRGLPITEHIGYQLRTSPDMEYVNWLRDHWQGPLVLKGIMNHKDVERLEAIGVDALWVSNHAGRQFDGTLTSLEVLPSIRRASKLPIIFDSGVERGMDILRALALGADFVMLGSAWHFALGALGRQGPAHLTSILQKDLIANMGQLGLDDLNDCARCLCSKIA
ncbi:alpha-hydroxy acid oxidase [Rhodobacteraceae bacterium nBUS_24]